MAHEDALADQRAAVRQDGALEDIVVGSVRIQHSSVDVRGARRRKPQLILSPLGGDSTAGAPIDPAALVLAAAGTQASEIYVRWPGQKAAELAPLLAAMEASGLRRDVNWPVLSEPDQAADELMLRLSRHEDASGSPVPSHGLIASLPAIDQERHGLVAALQSEIECAAARAIHGSPFDVRYRVVEIMTVGSTSRGTYLAFPTDFDLVVCTEREQTGIEHTDVEAVCDRIIKRVKGTEPFEHFVQAAAPPGASARELPRVALQFLGPRGPQSLVARYDLVWPSVAGHRISLLDVTFGKLGQLIGYETWLRRQLESLRPQWSARLRDEIRAAKAVLKRLDLYGSARSGLRAHAVEQWILQGFNYRAPGLPVGTLDSALRLIVEEATDAGPVGDLAAVPFEDYKSRFPLWHPGWWESNVGLGISRRKIDLWDMLGDGDAGAARVRWHKLVALALAYVRDHSQSGSGDLEDLARSAEMVFGTLIDTRRSLGS